jgi:hypothetical protein
MKEIFTLIKLIVGILVIITISENYTHKPSISAQAVRFMEQIVDAKAKYYSTHSGKYVNGDLGELGVNIPTDRELDYDANNRYFTVYTLVTTINRIG